MIGHLFYTTSSFVHHFKFISEFKLELQSRNAQFGSKSKIFLSRVTLTFDRWPWKTIRYLFYTTVGFLHHFNAIGEFKLELQSRNPQFGSKSVIFLSVWSCNLMKDLQKTIRHLFYTTSNFVHHFKAMGDWIGLDLFNDDTRPSKAMGEFKLGLQSGNAQFESKSVITCIKDDTDMWN